MILRMDPLVHDIAIRALGVRLLVMFGSRARGTARPDSDLDVGVLLGTETPGLMDRSRGEIEDSIESNADVDLVFLGEADPLLMFEVATTGRPLFEDAPGAFEEFRVLAVKRYYDTAWIRTIEADALRRRYA